MLAHATQTKETERKTVSRNTGKDHEHAKTHDFPTLQQPATVQRTSSGTPPQTVATRATPVENNTGLPDKLKAGIENLSGLAMDDVKVHYNSPKPAQLHAHAYAQGTDIHLASGQEKHLPHEAWHVIQQKQGRVQPTMQMNGANINDSPGLEKEADAMGARASRM